MKLHVKSQIVMYVNSRPSTRIHLRNLFISLHNLIITYIPLIAMYIIFMSGAHGVVGWVWCGGGWVSVDRQLFHRLWCLGGFGAVVFGTLLRLELEGSREGILYDEIYITILN